MIIAIDFDGTLVDHRFPDIGEEAPGAFDWLKRFKAAGAKLMLWTMRSDGREDGGNYLTDAVEFCRARGVEFWSANVNPEQHTWSGSHKQYAHVYIDDAAACTPMRELGSGRKVVDWSVVGPIVMEQLEARQKRCAN
jgi:hypothetical protein